jgi:signal peptidase I
MNLPMTKPRKPWLAALLSFLCSGLGHIYCGRIVAGLVLLVLGMLPVPVVSLARVFAVSPAFCGLFLVSLCVSTTVTLYAMIASYRLAKRLGPDYALKEYNRPIVYVALILTTGLISPAMSVELALAVRENVAEAFVCPAESMLPTIVKGDRFLVNKRAYRDAAPQRGDIIVFRYPGKPGTNCVKRVVGLAGDRVEVRAGEVCVNGKPLPRKPADSSTRGPAEVPDGAALFQETNGDCRYLILEHPAESRVADYPEAIVSPEHVFVLGDNRDHSADSRKFGFVPVGDIKGRAGFLYWPVGRWSRFGHLR